jgi:co-chaperonin GroES (HSP10)
MTKVLTPRGWKILIKRPKVKEQTKGGILLPDQIKEAESYMSITATVVALGSVCYRDRDTGEPWKSGPWCYVGDTVIVPKFTQFKMEIDNEEYRFINDDEVIAVVHDPDAIKVFT